MVLADLGKRINAALADLTKAPVIDEKVLDAILKDICAALLESDVNVKLVGNLRKSIKQKVKVDELGGGINKKRIIQKVVFDELINLIDSGVEPFKPKKGRPNVIMFVGLQGSGKTTTCTKLAVHYQKKGFKCCLVCADTFRAGAFDQLKQNATKAKIPFYGSYTETDPVTIASEGVEKFKQDKFEIIIVDTSGRHKQEIELFEEMKQISEAVKPDQTVMVLDANIGQAAESQAIAFKETADFGAIIVTKLDGHARGGGAISAVAATHTPIIFIGTGEHMYDFERFSPRPFISKMLGMGDMEGLMEHVQDMKLDQNKDMIKRLEQGVFTIKDLRDQLSTIMKMGPLSKLAGMVPGMPAGMLDGANGELGTKKVKRMLYIIDSMGGKELNSDGKIFALHPSKIRRIARGSGTSVQEVEELLVQHKMFATMVKKMGGGGKNNNLLKAFGGSGPGGNSQMTAQKLQQMQRSMDPRTLKQMQQMQQNFDPKALMQMQQNLDPRALKQMQDLFRM